MGYVPMLNSNDISIANRCYGFLPKPITASTIQSWLDDLWFSPFLVHSKYDSVFKVLCSSIQKIEN